MAGPLALALIIIVWALLLAAGFALIYMAVPAAAYRVETGSDRPTHAFWTALYFSLEVMTTLGLGDIKPGPAWFRVLVTLHTLIGFALVSASVTWILLIFPALSRIRALATTATLLAEAGEKTGIPVISEGAAEMLAQLADGVTRFRVDLIHFPIVYYFRSESDAACMGRAIGLLDRFACESRAQNCPERIRLIGTTLDIALDHAAEVLARFVEHADRSNRRTVFEAFARQHARTLAG